jgi:hypothetical protein
VSVIFAVLFICLLPGAFYTGALFPLRCTLTTVERLALSILLSWVNVTVIGLLLVALHQFNAPGMWAGLLITTVLGLLASIKQRTAWHEIAAAALEGLRSWKAYLGILVGVLVLVPATYWLNVPLSSGSPSFYYYNQAITLVELGAVPDQVTEYNTEMEPINNKIAHNLISASVVLAGNLDTTAYYTVQLVIATFSRVIAVLGLWAFGRRFFPPVLTAYFIVMVLWIPQIATKMAQYRAEGTGLGLFFIALFCIERAFANPRSGRWAIIASLSLSLTALVHGVSGLVAVMWYAALVIAYLVKEHKNFLSRVPGMALTAALTGTLVMGTLLVVGSGHISNQEVFTNNDMFTSARSVVSEPANVFRRLATGSRILAQHLEFTPVTRRALLIAWNDDALEIFERLRMGQGLKVAALLISILWAWSQRSHRPVIIAGLVFSVMMFALGVYFARLGNRQQLELLAQHATNREFRYLQVFSVLWFTMGLYGVWRLSRMVTLEQVKSWSVSSIRLPGVWRLSRIAALPWRDWVSTAGFGWSILLAASFLALAVSAVLGRVLDSPPASYVYILLAAPAVLIALFWRDRRLQLWRAALYSVLIFSAISLIVPTFPLARQVGTEINISASGHQAMEWLVENTPPDSVVVTNVRTTGVVEVFSERASWTEGRAPYFQPDHLAYAVDILLDFRQFYDCPAGSILREHPVDYVVVVTSPAVFGAPFNRQDAWQSVTRLQAYAGVQERAAFGDVFIFEVLDTLDHLPRRCNRLPRSERVERAAEAEAESNASEFDDQGDG